MVTQSVVRSGITRNVTRGVTESFFSGITPTLHAAFAEDKSLVSRIGPTFSITRATDAKYRDSSGVVQTASSGVARFDHDASGTSLGLLVEPLAATNIALHSNDWTNAVYDTVTNITPLKDATGPDGVANSASTLTATADNGVISQSITAVSAARTTSVWIKRKTGAGTVEITDNGFTNATDVTSDINSSTWTQVGKITRTQANPVVGIRLGTNGDEVEVAYLQVEAGAFATSPIETTTATVTRNADIVENTSVAAGVFNTSGSLYLDMTLNNGDSGRMLELNTGDDAGAVSINQESGSGITPAFYIRTSGGLVASPFVATGASEPQRVRIAGGYAADDVVIYVDGTAGTPDTNTTGTVPENLDEIHLGKRFNDTLPVNGHIAEIRYYNTRLTNSQLEDMSNGVFP